jgi:hypothetical protein
LQRKIDHRDVMAALVGDVGERGGRHGKGERCQNAEEPGPDAANAVLHGATLAASPPVETRP